MVVSKSGISFKNRNATDRKASAGQALNQSIVQQLTNAGNCRRRARKISPSGLIVMTICMLERTRLVYWANRLVFVGCKPVIKLEKKYTHMNVIKSKNFTEQMQNYVFVEFSFLIFFSLCICAKGLIFVGYPANNLYWILAVSIFDTYWNVLISNIY